MVSSCFGWIPELVPGSGVLEPGVPQPGSLEPGFYNPGLCISGVRSVDNCELLFWVDSGASAGFRSIRTRGSTTGTSGIGGSKTVGCTIRVCGR